MLGRERPRNSHRILERSNMESRKVMSDYMVYYGEYTLEYWIKMLLRKEIELPPYQRDFVWSEKKALKFLESLDKKQFIPSIIIGTYIEDDKQHHYVLDGQQRLSAILLAWLGYFPSGKEFSRDGKVFGNYDDQEDIDGEEADSAPNIKGWSFSLIQKLEKTKKEEIICSFPKNSYHNLQSSIDLSDNFFESKTLGFSYIRPEKIDNATAQKRYFSTLFRNINISGVTLSPIESRSSLYWLNSELQPFFQPNNEIGNLKIGSNDLDFARYLAILAQYKKEQSVNNLARGYSPRGGKSFEDYIEKYIYHLVGDEKKDIFYTFDENFNFNESINQLNRSFLDLDLNQEHYSTIIRADGFLFGLIYFIVFENKTIDITKKKELYTKITEIVANFTTNSNHQRSPNALKYIRERLTASIEAYKNFTIE